MLEKTKKLEDEEKQRLRLDEMIEKTRPWDCTPKQGDKWIPFVRQGDSLLVVEWLQGRWTVKNGGYKERVAKALQKLEDVIKSTIVEIREE